MNLTNLQASLVAQMVKSLPAMWETWVQSLGWEDPLEEGMLRFSHKNFIWKLNNMKTNTDKKINEVQKV